MSQASSGQRVVFAYCIDGLKQSVLSVYNVYIYTLRGVSIVNRPLSLLCCDMSWRSCLLSPI